MSCSQTLQATLYQHGFTKDGHVSQPKRFTALSCRFLWQHLSTNGVAEHFQMVPNQMGGRDARFKMPQSSQGNMNSLLFFFGGDLNSQGHTFRCKRFEDRRHRCLPQCGQFLQGFCEIIADER